jgi:hypothetical protein
MGVQNPNSTGYVHPDEPNLLNIHKAMTYDETGEPHLRVTLGSDNITITGDVNLVDTVSVNSTPEDPVHVHLTEVGTSGLLAVPYLPIGGTVTVTNTSFAITNFPTTSTVYQGTSPWVTTVTNWPALQYVNGTLYAVQSGTWSVGVTGTVSVSNFTSTVNVASMPAVSGTVAISSLPAITGTVVVSNFTSTVRVDNFPTSVTVTNFTSTVFVSNTLTISNTSFAVTNFPTTSTVYQGTDPWRVSGDFNTTITGTVTTTVVDGQQDAFGRLRVSEAFTLGDYKHTYGIDPNFRDTLTNGGTVTHIANQACARLATTSNTSSRAIHQTKMYHNYMPGKSQLIKTTINFYAHTANVTKRTGYYDDLNGIYFEQDGAGVLSFVIRTNTSGTASDARRIPQDEWNKDTCDGFGVSGFDLDITKTQIVFIDFQWLGVGRVRCGFVHDGQMIVAHEFYNSNNLPVVYMANPNLPVRCEILNTGATAGGYFDQICSTVVSEGGYMESGIDFSVDSGQTSQSITTANGMYPVVAIRLKNSFRGYPNRVVVRSGNINVYAEEYPAYWALYKLDNLSEITLSSSTWTSADADSAVEYTLLATAFTGGDRIDGGLVGTTSPGGSAKGTGTAPVNQPSNAKKNFIAQNIDSTDSEIYVVCGKAIGGTTKLWVDFQWREIY